MPRRTDSTRERDRERWREAADLLRVAEATSGYAARQVSDGLSPAEAREAVLDAAAKLAEVAFSLRKLARPSAGGRRRVTALLAASGVPVAEISRRLGISYRTARYYASGRRSTAD